MVVTPGGVRLRSEWHGDGPSGGDGGRAGRTTGRSGSPIRSFSAKARRDMRWTWNALPWHEIPRLCMITLTLPGDWRQWCPDGETFKRQLRAFRMRWHRKWGQPRGTWVREHQPRPSRPVWEQLAPHTHLCVGLPEGAVLEADPTDGRLVWDWARQAWWEIVRSGERGHRYWGVHVRPCFYGRFGDGQTNSKRVGDYLWRESGKLAQKEAPEEFAGVKWWDVWGLMPVEHEREIGSAEFVQMRRPLRRKRDEIAGVRVKPRDFNGKLVPRRRELSRDGLSVTNLSDGMQFGSQLLRWAEEEVEMKGQKVLARKGPVIALSVTHEKWVEKVRTDETGKRRWTPGSLREITLYGAACRACGASLPYNEDGELDARQFVRRHRCPEKEQTETGREERAAGQALGRASESGNSGAQAKSA